ncbi:MFS general substrate transporter [Rickenella mellea]|uniref:MFS general substrate transporter n=1 Tax=Rickenella mellea TaxID=50990 RepID=A0A4Y7QIS7_9AGAM|nr:MFS general substrate transporter [Rickenella mellea]
MYAPVLLGSSRIPTTTICHDLQRQFCGVSADVVTTTVVGPNRTGRREGCHGIEHSVTSLTFSKGSCTTYPDGGWAAWSNVLACTLVSFTSMGQVTMFGVFQTYYSDKLLPHIGASAISWIGSVQILLIYISGIVLGRFFDRHGAKWLLISGCLLSTFSLMMLSISKQYYQVFLSQGVGLGLGIALQFYPLLVVPSHWFHRWRALAVGIVVAGSSFGGVIFPIAFSRLFDDIGFHWSVRVMGFIVFITQGLCIPFIKERLPSEVGSPLIDLTAFKEVPFLLHAIGAFLVAFALYVPIWYIQLFALRLHVSFNLSFYIIAITNASGIVGRVGSGLLADKFGRFNALVPIAFAQSISCFAMWTTAERTREIIVFAIVYGFTSAAYSSLASSCVAQITPIPSQIGARTGMFMASMAPGILAGPPIAGAILAADHGSFLGMQLFCGALLLAGAGFGLAARAACLRIRMAQCETSRTV